MSIKKRITQDKLREYHEAFTQYVFEVLFDAGERDSYYIDEKGDLFWKKRTLFGNTMLKWVPTEKRWTDNFEEG